MVALMRLKCVHRHVPGVCARLVLVRVFLLVIVAFTVLLVVTVRVVQQFSAAIPVHMTVIVLLCVLKEWGIQAEYFMEKSNLYVLQVAFNCFSPNLLVVVLALDYLTSALQAPDLLLLIGDTIQDG